MPTPYPASNFPQIPILVPPSQNATPPPFGGGLPVLPGWQSPPAYNPDIPSYQYPTQSPSFGSALGLPDWKQATKNAVLWTVIVAFLIMGAGKLFGSRYK